MNVEEIAQAALDAAQSFVANERDLLEADANERSLTHKLAEYLQRAFADWNVDCEYNRLGDKVKRLPPPTDSRTDDIEGRTIFPDIIVHRRRRNENLLVIEVKKVTNKLPGDEEKLSALTAEDGAFAYALGLHLVLDCAECRLAGVRAFIRGACDDGLTEELRHRLGL